MDLINFEVSSDFGNMKRSQFWRLLLFEATKRQSSPTFVCDHSDNTEHMDFFVTNELKFRMKWIIYVFERPILKPSTTHPDREFHYALADKLVWHAY